MRLAGKEKWDISPRVVSRISDSIQLPERMWQRVRREFPQLGSPLKFLPPLKTEARGKRCSNLFSVTPVAVGYDLALLILNNIAFPNRFFNFLALPSATIT